MDRFSRRHGFEPANQAITVRNDAPESLRGVVVDIAYEAGLTPHVMRRVVCRILRVREDPSNWTERPNVDGEVRDHLDSCEWYEVYDIIEATCAAVARQEEDPEDGRSISKARSTACSGSTELDGK